MSERFVYICKTCGKKKELKDAEGATCCNLPMDKVEALPVCKGPSTAEHSRFDDESGPCDDGRSG